MKPALIMPGHLRKVKGCRSVLGDWEHDIASEVIGRIPAVRTDLNLAVANINGGMTIKEKVAFEKAGDYACFVELHFNSVAYPDAHGFETLYWHGSKRGLRLAQCLGACRYAGVTNRGAKPIREGQRGWYQLGKTKSPAVIVEALFLSNPREAELATRDEYKKFLAEAIVRGLEKFLIQED